MLGKKKITVQTIRDAYIQKIRELGGQATTKVACDFNRMINCLFYFSLIDFDQFNELLLVRDSMLEVLENDKK